VGRGFGVGVGVGGDTAAAAGAHSAAAYLHTLWWEHKASPARGTTGKRTCRPRSRPAHLPMPRRFVSALAYDLGIPEERAVALISASTAAATRARLLEVRAAWARLGSASGRARHIPQPSTTAALGGGAWPALHSPALSHSGHGYPPHAGGKQGGPATAELPTPSTRAPWPPPPAPTSAPSAAAVRACLLPDEPEPGALAAAAALPDPSPHLCLNTTPHAPLFAPRTDTNPPNLPLPTPRRRSRASRRGRWGPQARARWRR